MRPGGVAMSQTVSSKAEEILWQAVLQRDANFDGLIFYGVRSTKIYCRPTCPSRKPDRDRVCFFDSTQAEYAQLDTVPVNDVLHNMLSHPIRRWQKS